MPQLTPRPPSWCYPPTTDFECEACGAEAGEACDPAALYGPTTQVTGGPVHIVRARARGAEVLRLVRTWRESEGLD